MSGNTMNENLQLFEDQPIRTAWNETEEEWYFSIVDVVKVLTEQPDARHASTYWAVLKKRMKEEGAGELLTKCKQLKLKSPKDGKRYATDVANTEQLLRIIQSIPSKKAEPFKLWLAQVGKERSIRCSTRRQGGWRCSESYRSRNRKAYYYEQKSLGTKSCSDADD